MKEGRCNRVWLLGEKLASGKRVTVEWLRRDVRAGDTIVVTDARMFMEREGDTPRRRLFAGLKWLASRCAHGEVVGTDLHTRNTDARDALIERALDDVARASRGEGGGRPRKPFTAEELQWIEPIWFDRRIQTNELACFAVQMSAKERGNRWHSITVKQIYDRLSASGRRPLLKRKPAKKPKAK